MRHGPDRAHAARLVKFECDWFVDVGVYGKPPPGVDPVKGMLWLEERVRGIRGYLWSYSLCFSSEAQFWRMYDRGAHDRLRSTLHAEAAFPGLFAKVGGTRLRQFFGIDDEIAPARARE